LIIAVRVFLSNRRATMNIDVCQVERVDFRNFPSPRYNSESYIRKRRQMAGETATQ
jgi:hypothetical protein